MKTGSDEPTLSAQELRVLEYCCTELTYKEVASEMNLSPKTFDVYRSHLYEKAAAKTRGGLVLYALRNGFVKP
jgi:DNA-binding CsgD family transcriptional regulator